MQISRAQVHVFVEGREVDSYVYGKICAHVLAGKHLHRVTQSKELTAGVGGGKDQLIAYFEKLRRDGNLTGEFKGWTFTTLFFLDKDIDDVKRVRRRSPRVVYTPTYDIEGLIFSVADLPDAVAVVCSQDAAALRRTAAADWLNLATSAWRDWVVLCVALALYPVPGLKGYGSPSQFHRSNALNQDLHAAASFVHRAAVAWASLGLSPTAVLDEAVRAVDTRYPASPLSLFKGKWLPALLRAVVARDVPEALAASNFAQQLRSVVMNQVDPSAQWAAPYRHAIDRARRDLRP